MAITAHDLNGSPFSVGDQVLVRGTVTNIVSASTSAPIPTSGVGGSADSVTVAVNVEGNVGEKLGVTFVVSPVQCRRAAGQAALGVSPS